VILSRAHWQEIVSQALLGRPNEICGVLGGQDGRVQAIYPMRNVSESPRIRFVPDPSDFLGATDQIADAGLEVIAFYHSHTHTQAYPSPTDVAEFPIHWYPDTLCLICSLMEEDRPHLRAFRMSEAGPVEEEPLQIEE
jgi:proteasome lid subunit RPN8/RPN11